MEQPMKARQDIKAQTEKDALTDIHTYTDKITTKKNNTAHKTIKSRIKALSLVLTITLSTGIFAGGGGL
jgi:hypothetical protein